MDSFVLSIFNPVTLHIFQKLIIRVCVCLGGGLMPTLNGIYPKCCHLLQRSPVFGNFTHEFMHLNFAHGLWGEGKSVFSRPIWAVYDLGQVILLFSLVSGWSYCWPSEPKLIVSSAVVFSFFSKNFKLGIHGGSNGIPGTEFEPLYKQAGDSS